MNKANFKFENNPELTVDDFSTKLRKNGDFWRIHLDYCKASMNNELGVY